MLRQTLLWTSLPNGVTDDGHLRLSVLVTPRLEDTDRIPRVLAEYPDLRSWPETDIGFLVRMDTGEEVEAIPDPTVEVRRELWEELFGDETQVVPYQYEDWSGARVHSYPVGHVDAFIRRLYADLAVRTPTSFPQLEFMINRLQELAPTTLRAAIEEIAEGRRPVGTEPDPTTDFARAHTFHRRGADPVRDAERQGLDFHVVLGALSDHPQLLRAFGIIRDLLVPLRPAIGAVGAVWVVPRWESRLPTFDCQPRTRFMFDGSRFTAAWRDLVGEPGGRQTAGRLNLQTGYHVTSLDVDTAALVLMDYNANLHRRTAAGDDSDQSAPAFRSAGLSLGRRGRAAELATDLESARKRNEAVEAAAVSYFDHHIGDDRFPILLTAEDLTRGYRVDVWSGESVPWRSLCARQGVATFLESQTEFRMVDEGTVTLGATAPASGGNDRLFLHESMLRWNGWSLVAPRPGLVLAEPEPGGATGDGQGPDLVSASNEATRQFPVRISYRAAPRSLPRLRFGNLYRFGLRAVDVAGNSVPLQPRSDDVSQATEPTRYGRWEPVPPPVLALRAALTPGEAIERPVIRSRGGHPSSQASYRHLIPPKMPWELAEAHGQFDRVLENRRGGQRDIWLDERARETFAHREAQALSAEGERDPIIAGTTVEVPYLPDVMAAGVAFVGLPGTGADEVVSAAWGYETTPWPDATTFVLEVVEGEAPPQLVEHDAGARTLRVFLPKATRARVRYSSLLDQSRAIEMALVIDAGINRQLAASGQHWMLTPARELELVHAVQWPLIDPVVDKVTIAPATTQTVGQTTYYVDADVHVDRASMAKVEIDATWEDWIDPEHGPFAPRPASASIGKFTVDPMPKTGDGPGLLHTRSVHVLGDTRHRVVQYSATASTPFDEFFRETATVTFAPGTSEASIADYPVAPNSDRITTGKGKVLQRDVHYRLDHAASKIERISGISDGEQLTVAFLPYPVTRTIEGLKRAIPNSARPPAPRVLYTVPTFGWEDAVASAGRVRTSTRGGNGLRVWLDRPWYTSGEDELLGVVVPTPGPGIADTTKKSFRHLVTTWGADPTRAGTELPSPVPTLVHLAGHHQVGSGLSLAEHDHGRVDVAGFKVHFDADRELWFADIAVDPGRAYAPFVRLALARFQPYSVPGCELSPVTLADFMQLSPDRQATVVREPDGQTATVTVRGRSYAGTTSTDAPAEMEVAVQRRDPRVADDTLGWSDVIDYSMMLAGEVDAEGGAAWTGSVAIPARSEEDELRLLIREYERFQVWGGHGSERRLVYADTMPVP